MNNNIWIEVNPKNLAANLKTVKRRVGPKVKVMGVVKQNAYGHGLVTVSKALSKAGIDFLGVNNREEALALLTAGVKTPLLVLSNTIGYKDLRYFLKNKVRFTVMDKELLNALNSAARKNNIRAFVHVKVDTGMSRLGLSYDRARAFIQKALTFKNINIEGVYSHLSSAESNYIYTFFQVSQFKNLLARLKKENIDIRLAHICNSAGFVNFKNAHLDMVRIGLLLYGIKPHPNLKIDVRPALSLKAKIIHIKKVPKNSFVSYANTFKTKKETPVGIIACGYAYGYPWNLSSKAEVIIKGRRCKVLGRICMDHMVVDLSGAPATVKKGDTATLIGRDRAEEITAQALAKKASTIPYEIVTRLSPQIKRKYT